MIQTRGRVLKTHKVDDPSHIRAHYFLVLVGYMDQYHYDYMECVCPMDVLLEGGGINSVSLVVNGTVAPQEN